MDPFYSEIDEESVLRFALSPAPPPPSPPLPPTQGGSAFVAYRRRTSPVEGLWRRGGGRAANVHRRVLGYLRRVGAGAAEEPTAAGAARMEQVASSPRFRHIMRERVRRERMSQGYADLHAFLPPGTSKGDKVSIVRAAATYLRELKGREEKLRARNEELERVRAGRAGLVVTVRVENSSIAPIEAVQVVLRSLKLMGLTVATAHSCFSAGGVSMKFELEASMVSSHDVENVVTRALVELKKTLCMQTPNHKKWFFSCKVENGELIP